VVNSNKKIQKKIGYLYYTNKTNDIGESKEIISSIGHMGKEFMLKGMSNWEGYKDLNNDGGDGEKISDLYTKCKKRKG